MNYVETISTLRYANRAKNIENKTHVNSEPGDALLTRYVYSRLLAPRDKQRCKHPIFLNISEHTKVHLYCLMERIKTITLLVGFTVVR